jgi:iron-sulfur cluster repair protein YtfE (RIC family)
MGEDHDRLDSLFKGFRSEKSINIDKAKSQFLDFQTGLLRHIVWEEEILFPIFEQKTGMHDSGPTAVMRMEHRQIKEFLEKIHNKIAAREIKEITELEDGLLEVLTAHNEKEENILYPWIDNSVSEEEREEAFKKMKNLPPEKFNQYVE